MRIVIVLLVMGFNCFALNGQMNILESKRYQVDNFEVELRRYENNDTIYLRFYNDATLNDSTQFYFHYASDVVFLSNLFLIVDTTMTVKRNSAYLNRDRIYFALKGVNSATHLHCFNIRSGEVEECGVQSFVLNFAVYPKMNIIYTVNTPVSHGDFNQYHIKVYDYFDKRVYIRNEPVYLYGHDVDVQLINLIGYFMHK